MNFKAFEPPRLKQTVKLPVLDRMLASELGKTVLAVAGVLVTIIVSRKFLGILTKAIEGEVAAETLLTLLGLKMLAAFITLFPAALFLSLLMVFGRMYRDQEMAVLASSGVGLARIYQAAAWFVLPAFLLSIYFSLVVVPWTEAKTQSLMKQDEKTADLRGIKPGKFNEFSRGDLVLYAESLDEDENVMHKIFVQSRSGDKSGVTVADSGYLKETESGIHYVVLNNGRRYQGVPGDVSYVITEYGEYNVKIDTKADTPEFGFRRESTVPTSQLLRTKLPRDLAEIQRRLSIPLGILFLGILAIPISKVAPRSGVYGNVMTAFLIYIVYENLQRVSQGLTMSGKVPLWLSYSGVYLILAGLIGFFLIRAAGVKWLWQVATGRAAR